ncbi:hypothetical protein [Paenibacillus sp. NEAU-GSW1]|uniref:hypothetical protein n=1 Tax=Paenibacillus sp. NEAU-GSW1 TaxID=2682486 RepID=UPI0012E2E977|nr:hypothetical protein [Paenibacillus sp. NEAU-GSW1]MUT66018.1 hypothetical protein [Paenibacillus sp. NEAU-GSW1]
MAKAGNPGSGKSWKTSDFKDVIMTDNKIAASMGQKTDDSSRSKGAAITDYSKK